MIQTIWRKTLFVENCSVDSHTNTLTLNATTEYILTTKRFDDPCFTLNNIILLVFLSFI